MALSCKRNSTEVQKMPIEINFVQQFSESHSGAYFENITSYIDKSNGNLIYIISNSNGIAVNVIEKREK
jgi:hypothetical protein